MVHDKKLIICSLRPSIHNVQWMLWLTFLLNLGRSINCPITIDFFFFFSSQARRGLCGWNNPNFFCLSTDNPRFRCATWGFHLFAWTTSVNFLINFSTPLLPQYFGALNWSLPPFSCLTAFRKALASRSASCAGCCLVYAWSIFLWEWTCANCWLVGSAIQNHSAEGCNVMWSGGISSLWWVTVLHHLLMILRLPLL